MVFLLGGPKDGDFLPKNGLKWSNRKNFDIFAFQKNTLQDNSYYGKLFTLNTFFWQQIHDG